MYQPLQQALFELGTVCITPSALDSLGNEEARKLIKRHSQLDQGDLDEEDHIQNMQALQYGDRILSAYEVHHERYYVITEADRNTTTVLKCDEY